jgi:hypothetical protein
MMDEAAENGMTVDDEADRSEMTGVALIAAERQRQVEKEGWTSESDSRLNDRGEMLVASDCYAKVALEEIKFDVQPNPQYIPDDWPWGSEWWKPSDDPIRNLEKAGALIAAEIDRLKRMEKEGGGK